MKRELSPQFEKQSGIDHPELLDKRRVSDTDDHDAFHTQRPESGDSEVEGGGM